MSWNAGRDVSLTDIHFLHPPQGYNKGVVADGRTIEIPSKNHSSYSYDHVCDDGETQEEIFENVGVPVTDAFLEGYHGCLIAYGQTGAGKTFTMQGPGEVDDNLDCDVNPSAPCVDDPDAQGLIPRVLQRIFQRVEDEINGSLLHPDTPIDQRPCDMQFMVKCSYLEIYNEQVADLLLPVGSTSNNPTIREHEKKGVFVEGLTEALVTNAEETYDLFTKGSFNRRVGMTEMNRESSRSHAVFTVSLESKRRPCPGAALQKKSALLHLVDLAGSERQKSTDSSGDRLKEASAINKSLSALGNVIKALVDVADGKERHVPYRDSKLTYLLKDALGGRARCTLLACVSPAAGQLEETLSTLKFAQRAKLVKIKAIANEEAEGSLSELAAEVVRLRALIADGGCLSDADARERVSKLEQHVARANRLSASAAKASAATSENLELQLTEVSELSKRLDKNLQSTKMVLRLRDEALKKKNGNTGDAETRDEEMEALRKLAECPPEVVRVRVQMQALRSRMEHLEAENDVHPQKGRMAQLESELQEIRVLRVEEGQIAAGAIERAVESDKLREIAETQIAASDARTEASERRAADAEEAVAAAKEAQTAAEESEAEAIAAKALAEENAARHQATFEEQKSVMEEMFGQIEQLDGLRVELEKKLAASVAENASALEKLATLEHTKASLDEAKSAATAATARSAMLAVRLEKADKELLSAVSSEEEARSALVSEYAAALEAAEKTHITAIDEAEQRRVEDVAACEHKLEAASKSIEALVAAHDEALAEQKAAIESAASQALESVEAAHADALDAVRTAAAEETVLANEAATCALDEQKSLAALELEQAMASADEALEIAKSAALELEAVKQELDAMKTSSADALEMVRVLSATELNAVKESNAEELECLKASASAELDAAKTLAAQELEQAKAAADEALEVAKAAAEELEATKESAAEDLALARAAAAEELDAVRASAASELEAAKAFVTSCASEDHTKMLAAIQTEHALALTEASSVAKGYEQALHKAAADAISAADALRAANEETKVARVEATAAATALEAARADTFGKTAELADREEALAAAKRAGDETAGAHAVELEMAKISFQDQLDAKNHALGMLGKTKAKLAGAATASNAELEKARAEAASALSEEKQAHAATKQALEAARAEAAAALVSVESITVSEAQHTSDLAKLKETLESAAKAGMRAQEKMLASAETKLAETNAELTATKETAAKATEELERIKIAAKASEKKTEEDGVEKERVRNAKHQTEMEALRVSLEAEASAGHAAAAGSLEKVSTITSQVATLTATVKKLENRLAAAAGVTEQKKDTQTNAHGVDGAMTAALISARVDAEEAAERAEDLKNEVLEQLDVARQELASANIAAETAAARERRAQFELEALKAAVARDKANAKAAAKRAEAKAEEKTVVVPVEEPKIEESKPVDDDQTPSCSVRKTPVRKTPVRKEKGVSAKAPKSTPGRTSKRTPSAAPRSPLGEVSRNDENDDDAAPASKKSKTSVSKTARTPKDAQVAPTRATRASRSRAGN